MRRMYLQGVIGETVKMRPQHLFAQIAAWTAGNADDECLVRQGFFRPGIVVVNLGIIDQTGEHIDARDARMLRQGAGQFHYIGDLTTGIGIAPQLQIMAAHQAVDADQH